MGSPPHHPPPNPTSKYAYIYVLLQTIHSRPQTSQLTDPGAEVSDLRRALPCLPIPPRRALPLFALLPPTEQSPLSPHHSAEKHSCWQKLSCKGWGVRQSLQDPLVQLWSTRHVKGKVWHGRMSSQLASCESHKIADGPCSLVSALYLQKSLSKVKPPSRVLGSSTGPHLDR